jgi:hypothetical protein
MVDSQQMSWEAKLEVMPALWEELTRDEHAVASPTSHEELLRETEERVNVGVGRIGDWLDAKAEWRKRAE